MSFIAAFEKLARFDIEKADKEVGAKSDEQIDKDTAYTWGSRAIACFNRHKNSGKIGWFIRGMNNYDEALEHAGRAKDQGKTLKAVESEMDKYRQEPK